MISFNTLANDGAGLGNQMFRYAVLKSVSSQRGVAFLLPAIEKMRRAFPITESSGPPTGWPIYAERSFCFDATFIPNCPDEVNLSGFFQTEKYFLAIEEDIRKEFTFNDMIKHEVDQNIKQEDFIVLHVRRGDYLALKDYHPLCDMSYYRKALNRVSPDLPIYVFSDDPLWCSKVFTGDRYTMVVCLENIVPAEVPEIFPRSVVVKDDISSLYLMTKGSNFICANSSFSWWGAWLSKSKNKVIFPKRWLGPAYTNANYDTKDLCQMRNVEFEHETTCLKTYCVKLVG